MKVYSIIKPLAVLFSFALLSLYCTPKASSDLSQSNDTKPADAQEVSMETPEPLEDAVVDANKVVETAQERSLDLRSMQPTDPIPKDPAVRMGTLANGLKYYIRKNQKPEDRAELRMALKAGSINEDDDQQGLAHFLEHMAFNGSKNFKKSELVDYLESIGTKFGPDLNAYTSFDETVYMLQVRTDDNEIMNKGLTVLQDWAGGLTLDHEEIDKERGVVMSEWRSGLSPNERMLKEWFPVMYKGSRYANRFPIGKPEIIQNAAYDAVKRFYKDWYRPNLMAISIVGDIDVDAMEMEIKKRFSGLKNPENPRKRDYYKTPMHEETYVAIASDEEAPFTNVQLMYKHPHQPTTNMVEYRQSMVRRLYNGMINSRLRELTQSANPPFNFASTSYNEDYGQIDAYSSNSMVPAGGALKGLEVLLTENERVRQHGFTASEFERQKVNMLNSMERAYNERDKTDSRRYVMRYVYNFLDNIPMPSIEDEYKMYQMLLPTIQLAEINMLAKKWITTENRAVVVTGPASEETPLPSEAEIRAVLDKVEGMEVAAYEEEVSDEPLLDKELMVKAPLTVSKIEDLGITEVTYPNGVKVVLKPTDFKNDQILMSGRSAGGHSLYSDEDYFSVSNAASIVGGSGVGNFDAVSLQKKMAGKTVRLNSFVGELFEGMNGSAAPKDLETMLQLLYLGFTQPRKDADMFSSMVTRQKSIYQNVLMNPQYYFMNETMKIQYNDNPRYKFPTVEDFDALKLDELYADYQQRFKNAGDFTFFFVGNFDVEEMIPMLGKYLGNLPGNATEKENFKDLKIDYVDGVVKKTLVNGAAPKAMVDITFHGDFEWTPENAYNFYSMIDVLRIKMRESMREDKGGVYGVRVAGDIEKYPSSKYDINISFNADPPMVEELIATAINDIKNAKMNGAEEKDLTKVKETQRQERIKQLKENGFWLNNLVNAYWYKGDIHNVKLEKLEAWINSFDSKDVSMAANKYFDMNNYIQIVMMPEE